MTDKTRGRKTEKRKIVKKERRIDYDNATKL